MRKFLIKFWFGIYRNRWIDVDRSFISNMITLIPAVLSALYLTDNSDIQTAGILIPFAILAFNTFFYFRLYPVNWYELDRIQRWYYGYYFLVVAYLYVKTPQDILDNIDEWLELNDIYGFEVDSKNVRIRNK